MAGNYSDEKINLVLNVMNENVYKQLKDNGEVKNNELYLLPEENLEPADYVTLNTEQTITGTKTFSEGIRGELETHYAYNSSNTNQPWHKIFSATLTNEFQTVVIPILVYRVNALKNNSPSLMNICLRIENVKGEVNPNHTNITFTNLSSHLALFKYKLFYKNHFPNDNQATIDFWVYNNVAYAGLKFEILAESYGINNKLNRDSITWYDGTVRQADEPTGYTGSNDYNLGIVNIGTPTDTDSTTSKQAANVGFVNSRITSIMNTSNKISHIVFNGIITQWGYGGFLGSGTVVTFPKPFPNRLTALLFGTSAGGDNVYAVGVVATESSLTSFKAHGWQVNKTSTQYAWWMAIGY